MKVTIIQNITVEGPGTIEHYLQEENIAYSIVDIGKGDPIPGPDEFTHIVIMGGPMAVYEIDRYPHLRKEAALIGGAIRSKRPVLGVCLGAQMLAHVLGARVYPGARKEIGWYDVTLTSEGMKDDVMGCLAVDSKKTAKVFQWHGDTFDLPAGAVQLASSHLYRNQAFRYSDRVYALQFHIEVTPNIVLNWLKSEKEIDLSSIDAESNAIYGSYRKRADNFYRKFFTIK